MAITVNTTNIVFNDATTQSTSSASRGFQATVYNTPGYFTYDLATKKSSGLKYIKVTLVGAGGGGGASSASQSPNLISFGSRGGYGTVAYLQYKASSLPSSPIQVLVGDKGNGGSAPLITDGGLGGSTVWRYGEPVAVIAPGGKGGWAAPIQSKTAIMSTYGSSPSTGAADINGLSTGSDSITTLLNGYVCQSYGVVGQTAGVPVWYDYIAGSGSPTTITPSSITVAGTNGTGYGVGGGGGRTFSGPGPAPVGAYGGNGTPGLIIIEEYY